MSDGKTKDEFARVSTVRAWRAAIEAEKNIGDILERLSRIEVRVQSARYLQRCRYCGEPTLDVVCRNHWDLLEADPLAPARKRKRA